MSTIQRVTGTNSGLDVDALVKSAMQSYQSQIDKETQNEKVLEYQQQQYKQIMSDASDFYDKYFDVLKTGNLMSSSSYQTQTFTSTDGSKVSARGLAGATLDNYSVNVTQLASTASDTLLSSETGVKSIKIGTSTITFNATSDGSVTVANYNKAIADEKARLNSIVNPSDAEKQQLSDLNNKVVTAKYSQFSGNVTFTASSFGGGGFTIGGHAKSEDKYLEATVKNSKGEVYTISSVDKKTSNSITVDNVVFDFKGVSTSTSSAPSGTVSAVAQLAADPTFSPLTELTPLAESDGTTTKTTAADGTITTVTTSGGKTTTTVTATDKSTKVTTTQGKVTTVTDANGVITTTDTSNLDTTNKTGYTLSTVKVGGTTTTTRTNYDGTVPITKKIETANGTTTTTTTLKSVDTTTVKQDVYDGTKTTTTATTEKQGTNGSTITVENLTNGALTNSTTTQLTVGTDGKTTKTVSTSNGNPLTNLTQLTDLAQLTDLKSLTALPDNGTTQTDVSGIKTTTTADGTKTVTDTNTGIITTTAADGTKTVIDPNANTITTTNTDGTKSVKDTNTNTITTTATDGTETITKADGTKTTTKGGVTTVIATDGTKTTSDGTTTTVTSTDGTKTTSDGTTTTVISPDGTINTTKAGISTVTTAVSYGTPTTLTGATDASALKDKIVSFVNDYNKLLSEINTKIYETRDKNYMPLTDEQKKAMTDDQITAWEKKAQTGLLRKDNDLERIASEMKSAMSTVISGSGLSLEKIGIAPVKDYTDKNGMLTIDEDKLTTALEENGGDVKDLFTRLASGTDKGGALTQLKSSLYSEFKASSSSLSKKAGLAGGSTEFDNTITKNINDKKKLITQLNSQFTDKENALYNKYSALETAMEQLNAQKSSLASMLGQG
ncbi:flagellar filament capping protein FliD [Clostridium sp. YIM B02569]|uniref:flagellar filament capping protein FliD n=1 Tax=Clostridium sp. YIM B02569 TaxID=2911967 RepID=UPI001EECEF69|nr:flagellar filament capping protein FliD [Clostridium sp. YIM B02569]